MQVFVKYGLFIPLGIPLALDNLQFALLVFTTLSIAAAGYIINDSYDIEIDSINKPDKLIVGKKISEKNATRLYIILNILGVATGFYLSNSIGKPGFAAFFIVTSALLFMYSSYLKGLLLIGNIVISLLVSLSILIVGIFDIIPLIDIEHMVMQRTALKVVLYFGLFAFLINFIREIVKDIQDINGDKNGGMNTLPIAIGRARATTTVFGLAVLIVIMVVSYMYVYLYSNQILVIYFLIMVVGPLFYFCIRSWTAETAKDYTLLSLFLKIIMFLGMCSILLYPSLILK